MQLDYYILNIEFLKWLESNHTLQYNEYTKLRKELITLKEDYQKSNCIKHRIKTEQLEKDIIVKLEVLFEQFDFAQKQELYSNAISITQLDRIESNLSQQTFRPKQTKHKISWGVCDKDANPDTSLKQLKFKINKQEYVLEYKRDISVELDRTPIKKIGMKKNKDGTLGVNFYKHKQTKDRIIPKHYIFLITNGISKIVGEKINDVWTLKTQTNDLIVKKIEKFIKDSNL